MTQQEQIVSLKSKVKTLSIKNKRLETELDTTKNRLSRILMVVEKQNIYIPITDKANDIPNVVHAVIEGMFKVDINTKCSKREYVTGRQYYFKYLSDNTLMSYNDISRTLPKLTIDHTRISKAIKKFKWYFNSEQKYREDYQRFEETVNAILQTNLHN